MRILVIEDDVAMAEALGLMLKRQGFRVDVSDTAEDGLAKALLHPYELLLLDLVLPDMGGEDLLRRLRANGSDIPVLVLSSLCGPERKAKCLAAGADDYLTKPFDREELIARIQAVLRRSGHVARWALEVGQLEIDLAGRSVTVANRPVALTGKEFDVLELLAQRRGRTVTKGMFETHLYNGRDVPNRKSIDVTVCKLRGKLAKATGGEHYIDTVWGVGYRLSAPADGQSTSRGSRLSTQSERPDHRIDDRSPNEDAQDGRQGHDYG